MTTRILITGSTDGIGLAAAQHLLALTPKPDLYLHARSASRAEDLTNALSSSTPSPSAPPKILIADLSTHSGATSLAHQINALPGAPLTTIIHNAGLGPRSPLTKTPDGNAAAIAVNTLAPYIITALLEKDKRPERMLFLSSSLHFSGGDDLRGVDGSWDFYGQGGSGSVYNDSKLHDVLVAFAVARRWEGEGRQVCALDPGWIRTKMGGGGAPGRVETPARAIAEFAMGEGLGSVGGRTGVYFTPQGVQSAKGVCGRKEKQEEVLERCGRVTGVSFPED